MRWIGGMAAAALVLASTPWSASAQPANAEAVARAKAEGDALLKAARAEDLFVNESGSDQSGAIILRHRASGARCVLNPGKPANKVEVYPSLVRGQDVGCTTDTVTDRRSLFISYEPTKSSDELLKLAIKAVEQGDPTARVYKPAPERGGPKLIPPPGLKIPPHLTASLRGRQVGHLILLGKVGDWAIEHRFLGPGLGEMAQLMEMFWIGTALDQAKHGPLPAVAVAPAPSGPAGARAEADAIIAASGAPQLFENVTTDHISKVRLKPVGAVCSFEPGKPENALVLHPGRAPGDDVACRTRMLNAVQLVYFVKAPMKVTLDQALQIYTFDIRRAHPDAKPAKGTFGDVKANPKDRVLPPHKSARFTYDEAGQKVFSRLSVAVVGGWIIEQRLTSPMKDATAMDLAGEFAMVGVLHDLTPSAQR